MKLNLVQRKLIIAGLGPGKPELITLEALNAARSSEIIIVPRSKPDAPGIAEGILADYVNHEKFIPVNFPMINDEFKRSRIIHEQLINAKSQWEKASNIFFPVIGDSTLYSTGAYLSDELRKIVPDLSVELIPGISAHSLASTCAKRFLAMRDEILAIIPGTAESEKISNALKSSDVVAIYKPTALNNIHDVIKPDEYGKILRVDFAGIPERERVYEGAEALNDINEYLSIILLWKK